MRWRGNRTSSNIEDRRGIRPRAVAGGGGLLIMAVVVALLGGDPSALFMEGVSREMQYRTYKDQPITPEQEEAAQFVSTVLASTEDVWTARFRQSGEHYVEPTLVLFSGMVDSGCGVAQSATGPFYCPLDQKLYIDLSFFDEMKNSLQAGGDFAQAYVVAHEIGHHVQTLMGINEKVQRQQRSGSTKAGNQLSVRLELQADCFAGIWGHDVAGQTNMIEDGDIGEALNAATQIGDDRLQQRSGGSIVPDSFTHGTSAQRASWFRRGLEQGSVQACDTFSAAKL